MKKCSSCKLEKNSNEFYKGTNQNGLSSYCKECCSKRAKSLYKRKTPKLVIDDNGRQCRRCKEYKGWSAYSNRKGPYCRECNDHIGRKHNLTKRGISIDEYIDMEIKQNHMCAICGGKDKNKRLSVDHDHSCCEHGCKKCIRGLLCSRCNRTLGMINDDISILDKMKIYITKQ